MLRKWFIHNSSIQNKYLISTLCLILIPLGVFGIITLQISKGSIESQVSQSNLKTLGQISEKTDMLLDDVIAVSNTFYLNDEINYAFTAEVQENSYEEVRLRSTFERLITNSIYSFGRLQFDVTLLGLNGLEQTTNPLNKNIRVRDIVGEPWFQRAAEAKGRMLWITEPIPGLIRGDDGRSTFHAVRISNRFESGAPTGMVIISVNANTIRSLYEGALDDQREIVIVSDDGSIISAQANGAITTNIANRDYYKKIQHYDSGYFIDKEANAEQLISFQTIGKTGWKLVSYTPTKVVLRSLNQIQLIVSIVFIIVVLLSIGASYVMARRLAIPIKRLYRDFTRVETGDLSVRTPVHQDDEIGMLTRKFNEMVARLHELMVGITREQQQKRDAELKALQSQINPHFLYNTLTSIRFMLHKHDSDKVDSVIVALVKLLKQSISKHDELIPIEEEVSMLRNYMYIQQIRQGDRLEVHYEIDEEIMPFKMIKLILQPLVENAIFHGLEAKLGKGTLWIGGYMQEGDIWFEIRDDGVGMKSESAINGWLEPRSDEEAGQTSHGGGLRNVHERIQLYYGVKYGVHVESEQGVGTRIRVCLPALYKWEETTSA
ncbi:cache domain-containing sensor histidine kinase [Paenibacillus sp. Soil750]|uniref:cache domain-containing sensor histidine kinase n=1 Tax=Paenibacillus sp. Soil750 TaxID=1736398 RepID=UPI0006FCD33F|nr:sensor histidine kinase [Paenibacillus sp. Soil750]KRE58320.1 sensor with HAMP domain protein [Paenibacillus sp. Soil750]